MSKDIATPQTFQQKVSEKVKESIGDLITPEDLKPMIEESIRKLLTEERQVNDPNGYGRTITKPPLIQEMLPAEIEPLLREMITEFFTENPGVLKDTLVGVLGDGLFEAVKKVMARQIQQPIFELEQKIEAVFNANGQYL